MQQSCIRLMSRRVIFALGGLFPPHVKPRLDSLSLSSGRVTSKMPVVPLSSQDQKCLQQLFCWWRGRSQTQRLISWTHRMLKWGGRHEKWIVNAAWQTHCLLLRLLIYSTHTHTHTVKCYLITATEHERWKTRVYAFWFLNQKCFDFGFATTEREAAYYLLHYWRGDRDTSVCGRVVRESPRVCLCFPK